MQAYSLMIPAVPSIGAYRNISLFFSKTDLQTNERRVLCNLKPRRNWYLNEGIHYLVPSRTVLISMNQGKLIIDKGDITRCDWAPTACLGDINGVELDGVCAYPCVGSTCLSYNITVFLIFTKLFTTWEGSDSMGNTLTSYSRDIYRMKNSF
jgi:hypothetical protein